MGPDGGRHDKQRGAANSNHNEHSQARPVASNDLDVKKEQATFEAWTSGGQDQVHERDARQHKIIPPEDKMISIGSQETISKPEGRLVLHSQTNLSAQKQLFSYQIEKLNEEAHYQDHTESSNQ